MAPAVALSGWLAACVASLAVLAGRRARLCRVEAIARACHELRGPLTAARLGLELGVRRGPLSADRLRALDLELGRAALAIDDLASIAGRTGGIDGDRLGVRLRLTSGWPAGGSTRRWEEVEVRGLITDSVEAWRPFAEARGVVVRLRSAEHPAFVLADRLRVAQATGNLIANAIEHGGGAVDVRVEAAGTTIRIEFVDDGPGLPAPVVELAQRGRHRRGARGHGLAIAAAVAASHGGRLAGAPSERGARVVFELPLAVGAARAAGQLPAIDPSSPPAGDGLRI